MDAPFKDKVAVITGASRGIGRALADGLMARGLRVAGCARSKLEEDPGFFYTPVDVTDAAAVDAFGDAVTAELGPIDVWVNNAGVLEPIGMFRDLDPAAVRRHLEVNVLGVVHGSRTLLRLAAGRRATVINISSGAAKKPYAGWSVYCAGKAAVDLLTATIAAEQADTDIRAYALAPGVVDTDMQALVRAQDPSAFPMVERFHQLKADNAFTPTEKSVDAICTLAFGDGGDDFAPVLDVRNDF